MTELIQQNARMIHRIASRYKITAERNRGADMDDLKQAATVGMIEAVPKWDEQRGDFLTIAVLYMRGEVRRLLGIRTTSERIENAHQVVSLQTPLADDGGELLETVIDENAEDPLQSVCEQDMRHIIREAVKALPQEQREAVYGFFFQGKPARDINTAQRKKGIERLYRSSAIRSFQDEYQAKAFSHVGLRTFKNTHTSAVEYAVIMREAMERRKPNPA